MKHKKDPKINFDNKNKLKHLTEEEAKLSMNKMIQYQYVKQYVYKKQALNNNLKNVVAIIWGQCTSGVKSVFKGRSEFRTRRRRREMSMATE